MCFVEVGGGLMLMILYLGGVLVAVLSSVREKFKILVAEVLIY
jgi:hypothetical protein